MVERVRTLLRPPAAPGDGTESAAPVIDASLLAFLDGLPTGAALLDPGGALLRPNPALRALLGPAIPLRPGTPALHLLAPDARDDAAAWLRDGPADPHETRLAAPDGTPETHVLLRLAPMPGGAHALLIEDLSDFRRRCAELEAGEHLRALGGLAGGIAHDVNNLLAIILGAVDGVAERDPALREDLRPAADAAARGAALVRRLLAFARRQHLEPRVIDPDGALAALAPMLRSLLGRRIALELRPGALDRRVRVDPTQLDQVILNLATNARDAMAGPEQPGGREGGRAGEGTLTLSTDATVALREEPGFPDPLPPGRYVTVEVTDTGPGIPPAILPRIVEPFFTTRGAEGGTGLGLSTVHGIVRQSGGALQVESRPGRTRFRIHLPRHEGPAEPAPGRPGLERHPERHPEHRPPTGPATHHVLLVDDEAPLRRLAAVALERAGHTVTEAEDGDTALDLLREGLVPTAVVSDVVMPGLDGVALARELRARRPHLPVVLVSGYAEAALGADLGAEGVVFLPKPYRPAQLLEVVKNLAAAHPPLELSHRERNMNTTDR